MAARAPARPGGRDEASYFLGTEPLTEKLCAVTLDAGVEVTAFVENLDRSKTGKVLLDRPVI